MPESNGDVKGYSERLVRVASYPPFLTLTVKSRLAIYADRHERAMPKSKAAWVNIIASCCKVRMSNSILLLTCKPLHCSSSFNMTANTENVKR
jgi:hypothetical protein